MRTFEKAGAAGIAVGAYLTAGAEVAADVAAGGGRGCTIQLGGVPRGRGAVLRLRCGHRGRRYIPTQIFAC